MSNNDDQKITRWVEKIVLDAGRGVSPTYIRNELKRVYGYEGAVNMNFIRRWFTTIHEVGREGNRNVLYVPGSGPAQEIGLSDYKNWVELEFRQTPIMLATTLHENLKTDEDVSWEPSLNDILKLLKKMGAHSKLSKGKRLWSLKPFLDVSDKGWIGKEEIDRLVDYFRDPSVSYQAKHAYVKQVTGLFELATGPETPQMMAIGAGNGESPSKTIVNYQRTPPRIKVNGKVDGRSNRKPGSKTLAVLELIMERFNGLRLGESFYTNEVRDEMRSRGIELGRSTTSYIRKRYLDGQSCLEVHNSGVKGIKITRITEGILVNREIV